MERVLIVSEAGGASDSGSLRESFFMGTPYKTIYQFETIQEFKNALLSLSGGLESNNWTLPG